MIKLKTIMLAFASLLALSSCKDDKKATTQEETTTAKDTLNPVELVSVKDGKFYKGDQPYYFIGANYWYGPLIGAKNIGDRERLIKELDLMKSVGIDNLRILAGAEGDGSDSMFILLCNPNRENTTKTSLMDWIFYWLKCAREICMLFYT